MLAMYANAERDVAGRLTTLLNAPAQGPRQGYDDATGRSFKGRLAHRACRCGDREL